MYKSWMWKQRSYREQFQAGEGGGAGGTGAAGGGADDAQGNEGGAEGGGSDDEQGQGDDANQQGADQGGAGGSGGGDEEVVITIGDEPPPASNEDEIEGKPAPAWVKELRNKTREQARRIRELEQAAQASQQQAAPAAQALGPKPTPEDFEFDAEKFGEALLAWNDRKKAADAAAAAARQEQEAAAAEWQKRLSTYNTAKAALRVDDFDGAEHVVRETLSQTQQGIILQGADKPELLVYALGSNPAKAKELAAIKDPIKFTVAMAKLETQLKVAPRGKQPPAPERQVRGTTGGSTAVDNQLARLEAEADRSGDRSKVIAYKRELRNRQAA